MKFSTASTMLLVTALSACAGIPKRETDQQLLARYTSYAGAPVTEFKTYSRFDSWSPVDRQHVFIRTNVSDAYLLKLAPTCLNLPYATRIGFTSRFPHTVSSGFDSVRVGRDRCQILEIRPVNYKQMQADLKEEAKEAKEANEG